MSLTLYSMPSSGNSYKVRLLLALLNLPYSHVSCEDSSPELAQAKSDGKVPLGKVPALEIEDGTILSESNAILAYLAYDTAWFPNDRLRQAQVLGWMFFEQNRHEPVVAVRASLRSYPSKAHLAKPEYMSELMEAGHTILGILDEALTGQEWIAADVPTIADISLYAYSHTAGTRGGFEMQRFPNVTDWCERLAALPGYVGLEDIPA